MCIKALKIGKNAPIIVNAANEVAVEYFLENKIKFTDIPSIIKYVLNNTIKKNILTIPGILKCDNETRKFTQRLIEKKWK